MIEGILQPTGTERRLESKPGYLLHQIRFMLLGNCFEAHWLLYEYVLSASTLKAPTFCPRSVFIYFFLLWMAEQTAVIFPVLFVCVGRVA